MAQFIPDDFLDQWRLAVDDILGQWRVRKPNETSEFLGRAISILNEREYGRQSIARAGTATGIFSRLGISEFVRLLAKAVEGTLEFKQLGKFSHIIIPEALVNAIQNDVSDKESLIKALESWLTETDPVTRVQSGNAFSAHGLTTGVSS